MDRRDAVAVLVLMALGFLTRGIFFGYPSEAVFDEVHFGKYVLAYGSGEYIFDLHPPLGRLIVALFGSVFGLLDPVSFSSIGDALPLSFVLMRLVPMLFGALLPALLFILARLLGLSLVASAFAGLVAVFENSLVVQSRFLLSDSILLFFGFLALVFYLRAGRVVSPLSKGVPNSDSGRVVTTHAHQNESPPLLRGITPASEDLGTPFDGGEQPTKVAPRPNDWVVPVGRAFGNGDWTLFCFSALATAAAASVKWTGLSFAGLIGICEIVRSYRDGVWRAALPRAAVFAGIFLLTYFSVLTIHLVLLPQSGPGDAFHSPEFQKGLAGSAYEDRTDLAPPSLVEKMDELTAVMWEANKTIGGHQYASQWYTWPLMKRPIYYWEDGGGARRVYFLGNPLVYWLGAVAILLLAVWLARAWWKGIHRERAPTAAFILAGYAINFLPFMLITRVMFLYHYLAALLFSILALALLIDGAPPRLKRVAAYVTLSATVLLFLYFSPLTYGTEPFLGELADRFWFATWE